MMTFPGIKSMFRKANLNTTENHWCHVYDFDFNPETKIINWEILPPSQCKDPHVATIKGRKQEPNPVDMPQSYGGSLPNDFRVGSFEQNYSNPKVKGSMMAFDIREGQEQAQKAFDKQIEFEEAKFEEEQK